MHSVEFLVAVWWQFRQKRLRSSVGNANRSVYAKSAKSAMDAAFHQVLVFERGDVVQLVRTLPCHGRGRGFESRRPRHSFQRVIGRDTENSYPQSHPQLLLNAPRFESHGVKKLFLCCDHLVEVFVCVEVERGLDARVTQDALHRLRVLLRLVDQPVR